MKVQNIEKGGMLGFLFSKDYKISFDLVEFSNHGGFKRVGKAVLSNHNLLWQKRRFIRHANPSNGELKQLFFRGSSKLLFK